MKRLAAAYVALACLATACSQSAKTGASNLEDCCLPTPAKVERSTSCSEFLGLNKPARVAAPLRRGTQYVYIGNEDQVVTTGGDAYEDGWIAVYPAGQTTAVRRIHSGPVRALAFDARHIYAAQMNDCRGDGLGALLVYDKKTGSLLRTVKQGIASPRDLVLDRRGDVYVDNIRGKVTVYSLGATRLIRTISEGVNDPSALAIDRHQNLYIANGGPERIMVYRSGSVDTFRLIYTASPEDIALDPANNVYVASSAANSVTEYAAGTSRILRVIRGKDAPSTLGISRGLLYVGNDEYSTSVYSLQSGRFVRKLPDQGYSLAFDRSGRVYVSTWQSVELYSKDGAHLQTFDEKGAVIGVDPP